MPRRYDRDRFSGVSKPLISLVTKWAFFGGKPAGALESSEATAVAPGTKLSECCNEMRCALIRQSFEQKRRCRPRARRSIERVQIGLAHVGCAAGIVCLVGGEGLEGCPSRLPVPT